jgi:uncharacterized protein
MKQLDPLSAWIFFIQYTFVIFSLLSVLIAGLGLLLIVTSKNYVTSSFSDFWSFLLVYISIETVAFYIGVITGIILAHFAYKYYRYELREDGFRKEHGVIFKKYTTIPYERIQNVDIYRGILARILGLSDLHIQTVGMGSGRGSFGGKSEGQLPGVTKEEAEKLRNELIRRAGFKI